jgi:DNA repair protein RecO (recombination protein O)
MAARRERALPAQLDSYVLHRYDWSESSLILDVLTRQRGRLAVVAKGAKRPTSQLRSVLMPFQPIVITLAKSGADEHGDIALLRQAEWAGGGVFLPPAALFQGFYLNELLMKLLPRGDAHPGLFDTYAATLPMLAHGDELLAQAGLRAFELRALRESGVLPELSLTTLGQQAIKPTLRYALKPESGLVLVHDGAAALPGADWQAMQQALDDDALPELQRACLNGLAVLKPLLRGLLQYHLGTQSLRTREVMHSVQRLVEGPANAAVPTGHGTGESARKHRQEPVPASSSYGSPKTVTPR